MISNWLQLYFLFILGVIARQPAVLSVLPDLIIHPALSIQQSFTALTAKTPSPHAHSHSTEKSDSAAPFR